jgi:hypothetical protein
MTAPAGLLDHALAYAARGWPVFPLRPREKVPLIPKAAGGNGVHDATTDPDRIRAWWTPHPTANVGLAAGAAFWVLDVDYAGFLAEEPDGADTITALQRRFGRLPPTVRQYTGGMGWQWFFKPDPRIRNGVRVLPGLDTRSTGGYVVAPPSVHPSGRTYRWIVGPDQGEVATAPEWLATLLAPAEPPPAPRRPIAPANLSRYAAAALAKACERIGGTPPGAQNEALNSEAFGIGQLVGGGIIPREQARDELVIAGCGMRSQAGKRPWTRSEVAWRIDRALTAGTRNPRMEA